eukprot:scaffold116353_cov66-Phaeocystis_antarctica.AAC.7
MSARPAAPRNTSGGVELRRALFARRVQLRAQNVDIGVRYPGGDECTGRRRIPHGRRMRGRNHHPETGRLAGRKRGLHRGDHLRLIVRFLDVEAHSIESGTRDGWYAGGKAAQHRYAEHAVPVAPTKREVLRGASQRSCRWPCLQRLTDRAPARERDAHGGARRGRSARRPAERIIPNR